MLFKKRPDERESKITDLPGWNPDGKNSDRYLGTVTTDRQKQQIHHGGCRLLHQWVEAFPLKDQSAETVADTLVTDFVSRFGVPKQIHTDQGRNFESNLFKELCQLLGVDKTRTTPYHPQSDGMVERFNRTLEEMLAKVVDSDQKNWDKCIPLVMMAYRSSIHESTGHSPAEMMLGREIPLPVDTSSTEVN
ncbi:Retrovirus-related Pol polyprotein from transposon [Apostichopus japonicus]|uniref:Retrovirus-related Pol polyprotein from transposon n=1 Tax=Stichopus japonicus TaxID=307972 RepID=A0A2G8KT57_STIJA|nr:Retrovirus-related Pol polyprotein from transposon [Apostichopus japonicus]